MIVVAWEMSALSTVPAADAAFVARLKETLNEPERVKEVDLHLYTPEFARVAVDEFVRLYQLGQSAN